MKGVFTIIGWVLFSAVFAQNKIGAIGQWRGHYDNHSIRHIVKGDYIYAASPHQIIRIGSNQQKEWIDKSNGLNDIGISQLAWDPIQNQLIIAYENSNIDILKGDQVFNINDIQLTNLFSDTKINDIYIFNQWAMVSTHFGVVVIDLLKHEIKDNWFPNNLQQPTVTYNVTVYKDTLYCATEAGIWLTPLKNNWIQNNSWTNNPIYNGKNILGIYQQNGNLFTHTPTDVFQYPSVSPIWHNSNGRIQKIDTSTNALLLSIHNNNHTGSLIAINVQKTATNLVDSSLLITPMESIVDGNTTWVADSTKGLLAKNTQALWINTGGPLASIGGWMSVDQENIIAPFGNNQNGFARFQNETWTSSTVIGNGNLPVVNTAIISSLDHSYWFTSLKALLHLEPNTNQATLIQPNNNTGAYTFIQSDAHQQIWAIQDQQGIVRQNNSIWNNIALPTSFNKNGLSQFIVHPQGQAWLIAPNNQGLYVYQSKDNYSTEIWKQLTTAANSGNLPSTHVTAIAQDLTGAIWVGTDNGIGIFNCGDIANEPCNAYLPIVNNNGFNGYLFQHEIINCIAVDGANRKWIGTQNGAWLLSVDGLSIETHFTKTNSPLPSDTIQQIVINPSNGEVFFNTNHQMVSYRGTATTGAPFQNSIQIFPNPIPPSFNGTVAFKGLKENVIVKITDLSGKLLYQTKSLGGQAIWNGLTYDGKKPASGIYLVFVRDLTGDEKTVGKIVIADGY